jgi:uncharacterized protein (DUF488 family)
VIAVRGAKLYTIGYEGRSLDELLAMLQAVDVDLVIDVRELPLSRRRGFSKTPLGTALGEAGIGYIHLREAGNPYHRQKHRISRAQLLVKYRGYLAKAKDAVAQVTAAARGHTAALLCFEHDPGTCHRSILAPRVARQLKIRVADL